MNVIFSSKSTPIICANIFRDIEPQIIIKKDS